MNLCPVCAAPISITMEYPRFTVAVCPKCAVHVNFFSGTESFSHPQTQDLYNEAYFTDSYQAQYGRTYAQDQENIRRLSRIRLERLRHCMAGDWNGRGRLSIIDLGAALGFFLDEARQVGFGQWHGVEISDFACSYSRDQLSIPLQRESLLDWRPNQEYDIVTMFYVLEHFAEQASMLDKVRASVRRPGGWFVLSLPSIFGPHYRWRREEWATLHPVDHFVDYHPGSICAVLALYGLKCHKVFSSPLRKERLPVWVRGFPGLTKIAARFAFGDTMEIYARRI